MDRNESKRLVARASSSPSNSSFPIIGQPCIDAHRVHSACGGILHNTVQSSYASKPYLAVKKETSVIDRFVPYHSNQHCKYLDVDEFLVECYCDLLGWTSDIHSALVLPQIFAKAEFEAKHSLVSARYQEKIKNSVTNCPVTVSVPFAAVRSR